MRKYLFFILFQFSAFNILGQTLDARILHSICSPDPKPTDGFFKTMSQTNSVVVIAVPSVLFFSGIINHNKPVAYNAFSIGLATALNATITYGLKYTINRQRPFKAYPGYIVNKLREPSPSFPSGHTSSAFATATAFTLAYPKWFVAVPAYLWAGTVAYSRLELGMHYPLDVLAGIIIGAGCAYLSYKGNQWLIKKYNYLENY